MLPTKTEMLEGLVLTEPNLKLWEKYFPVDDDKPEPDMAWIMRTIRAWCEGECSELDIQEAQRLSLVLWRKALNMPKEQERDLAPLYHACSISALFNDLYTTKTVKQYSVNAQTVTNGHGEDCSCMIHALIRKNYPCQTP